MGVQINFVTKKEVFMFLDINLVIPIVKAIGRYKSEDWDDIGEGLNQTTERSY